MTASEEFPKVEKLVYKMVHKFKAWSGWNFTELLSEAVHEWFRQFPRYDSTKAKLTTWTWHVVRNALLEYQRSRLKHESRHIPMDDLSRHPISNRFNLESEMAEMSEDGQQAISAALSIPASTRPSKCRQAVVEALAELGWCGDRILESFGEIWEILK